MQSGDRRPRRAGWAEEPSPERLPADHPTRSEILARHTRAVAAGLSTYVDPATGFAVMTATYLDERGVCCNSGCRHCPWAH